MQPKRQVDLRKFKKVLILFNRYSGKQLFASMPSRINEVFKLLKRELNAKVEMLDVEFLSRCRSWRKKWQRRSATG